MQIIGPNFPAIMSSFDTRPLSPGGRNRRVATTSGDHSLPASEVSGTTQGLSPAARRDKRVYSTAAARRSESVAEASRGVKRSSRDETDSANEAGEGGAISCCEATPHTLGEIRRRKGSMVHDSRDQYHQTQQERAMLRWTRHPGGGAHALQYLKSAQPVAASQSSSTARTESARLHK